MAAVDRHECWVMLSQDVRRKSWKHVWHVEKGALKRDVPMLPSRQCARTWRIQEDSATNLIHEKQCRDSNVMFQTRHKCITSIIFSARFVFLAALSVACLILCTEAFTIYYWGSKNLLTPTSLSLLSRSRDINNVSSLEFRNVRGAVNS
jgi:hypothetical protein